MKKLIYISLFITTISSSLYGQFIGRDPLSVSLFYMQKSELDSAKKYIDKALDDNQLNTTPKFWYYRGFIYKDIYKTKEKDDKQSPARLTAIKALRKLIPIDTTNSFTEAGKNMLKYLASTLYNDAVRSLTPESYELSIANFEKYKTTMHIVNPKMNIEAEDVKFKLALASMLNRPSEMGVTLDSLQLEKIKKLYLEILEIDPENPAANYNLATIYYNEAADIINNMDYDMDIFELNKIQDYCIDIFLKALPYMQKSYELKYKLKETLIGLSNIYYGLNDFKKSEEYKKELEKLEKE